MYELHKRTLLGWKYVPIAHGSNVYRRQIILTRDACIDRVTIVGWGAMAVSKLFIF